MSELRKKPSSSTSGVFPGFLCAGSKKSFREVQASIKSDFFLFPFLRGGSPPGVDECLFFLGQGGKDITTVRRYPLSWLTLAHLARDGFVHPPCRLHRQAHAPPPDHDFFSVWPPPRPLSYGVQGQMDLRPWGLKSFRRRGSVGSSRDVAHFFRTPFASWDSPFQSDGLLSELPSLFFLLASRHRLRHRLLLCGFAVPDNKEGPFDFSLISGFS